MHLFHNVLISPRLNETIETSTEFVARDVNKVFGHLNKSILLYFKIRITKLIIFVWKSIDNCRY